MFDHQLTEVQVGTDGIEFEHGSIQKDTFNKYYKTKSTWRLENSIESPYLI